MNNSNILYALVSFNDLKSEIVFYIKGKIFLLKVFDKFDMFVETKVLYWSTHLNWLGRTSVFVCYEIHWTPQSLSPVRHVRTLHSSSSPALNHFSFYSENISKYFAKWECLGPSSTSSTTSGGGGNPGGPAQELTLEIQQSWSQQPTGYTRWRNIGNIFIELFPFRK